MSNETKTAIKSAEERLETERADKLKEEIYEFLKSELDEIERLDCDIRELNAEKRIHEENIKNVKQGNLQAIEERRKTLLQQGYFDISTSNPNWNFTVTNTSSFFPTYVAGMSIRTTKGKLYIF